MSIYLDNSSTTKVKDEIIDYAINIMKNNWYNPNSTNYDEGLEARRIIENSRKIIAEKINALPEEIIFTCSGSAANNLAIRGFVDKNDDCHNWVTTNIEHDSIYMIEINKPYVWKHIEKCDINGFLQPEQFEHYQNCLISVIGANNEIGSVQPIKDISKIIHKRENILHSDMTQYIPYYPIDVKELGADLISFSSHKLSSIRGTGVLYVKKGIELNPLIFGHQEKGLFAGTENVVSIGCLGLAMQLLNYDKTKEIEQKRNYLLDKLLSIDGITLNGSRENRLASNINICIRGICLDNMQLTALLGLMDYQVATGSACNTGENIPSRILLAIGKSVDEARHSIRITIGDNTYEELDKFYNDFKNIIEQYKIDN